MNILKKLYNSVFRTIPLKKVLLNACLLPNVLQTGKVKFSPNILKISISFQVLGLSYTLESTGSLTEHQMPPSCPGDADYFGISRGARLWSFKSR